MTSFNLRQVRLRSGEQYRDEQEVELEPFVFGGERYLPVPERVAAELTISRASDRTVFELRFPARLHGPCQRCLADAVVDASDHGARVPGHEPGPPTSCRTPYVVDDRLDLSAWARDALALALPEQILCRPDCAGLCPVCGEDLNASRTSTRRRSTDPRWAALAELREQALSRSG